MKTLHIISTTLLLAGFLTIAAGAESRGAFKYEAVDVSKIIEAYRAMTGLQLVVSSNVSTAPNKVTIESNGKMTATEAARLLEQALLEQAGIIVTRLDDKRVSVTFNDALKTRTIQTRPKPKLTA